MVLTVISILASLAFLAYGRITGMAGRTESANNMRQLGTAITLFSTENNDRLPDNGKRGKPTWDKAIAPYIGVSDNTLTATDADTQGVVEEAGLGESLSIFTTSGDTVARTNADAYPRSYALRAWTNNHNFGSDDSPSTPVSGSSPDRGIKLTAIGSLVRASLMVETFQPANIVGGGAYFLQARPSEAGTDVGSSDWMFDGKANVLFADGHLEVIRASEVEPVTQGPYWPVRD